MWGGGRHSSRYLLQNGEDRDLVRVLSQVTKVLNKGSLFLTNQGDTLLLNEGTNTPSRYLRWDPCEDEKQMLLTT